jgi:hypothetical protein
LSRCSQLQERAAGIAALAGDDPERQAAFEHARACPSCAAALAEGEAMLVALARGIVLEPPPAVVLARAAAGVRHELRLTRARLLRGRAAVVAAVVAAWLLPLLGGLRLRGSAGATGSVTVAMLAVVSTAVVLTLGSRALLILPLVSFAAAWLSAGSGPVAAAHGVECAVFVLVAAAIPLTAAVLLTRRRVFERSADLFAGAAGGGAVAGQAALYVTCHAVAGHGHLLLFHAAPVLAVMGLAALFGQAAFQASRTDAVSS